MCTAQTSINKTIPVSMWAFSTIAAGAVGCGLGGVLSQRVNSKKIAAWALTFSGVCCLVSPFIFQLSEAMFLGLIVFWGFMVVADSPQFSALVAAHAPREVRGSAITITTCIGFAITIVSIQLLNAMQSVIAPPYLFLLLTPGPILGVAALYRRGN